MFVTGNCITSIPDAVTRLKNVKDGQEFSTLLADLRTFLKTLNSSPQSPSLFRSIYENKVKEKQIHIVIHQPKML